MADKYGNAIILGQVLDGAAQTPISDALITLNSVLSTSGLPIQIFNEHSHPVQNPNVRTNKQGGFLLSFCYDPTVLTTYDNPSYRLTVNEPSGSGYRQGVLCNGDFSVVVSLSDVGTGRIPSFKFPDTGENVLKDLKILLKLKGWKFPNMFLAASRPTPDTYALLGAIRIGL
jgi:hypothetical protein